MLISVNLEPVDSIAGGGSFAVTSERWDEDTSVVSLVGEHDLYTAPRIEQALRGAVGSGSARVVVDLRRTTFLDSTVLHVLLRVRASLADHGRLVLLCDDPTILRVFELTGTDRLFDLFASRSALEAGTTVEPK